MCIYLVLSTFEVFDESTSCMSSNKYNYKNRLAVYFVAYSHICGYSSYSFVAGGKVRVRVLNLDTCGLVG